MLLETGYDLHHLPHPSRLNLINPPTHHHSRAANHLRRFQKLHIPPHRLLQVPKRQEPLPLRAPDQQPLRLFPGCRAQILLHQAVGVGVLEGEHAAAGVLDNEDLGGAEELVGDEEGAEGVAGGATGVADDVGGAEGDAEGGGGMDACVLEECGYVFRC